MKQHFKNIGVIFSTVVIGASLPFAAFAQVKTVTTVTSPSEVNTILNTATGIVAPATTPKQTITTDAAKELLSTTDVVAPANRTPTTQTPITQVLSPTTGIVAPTNTTKSVTTSGSAPTKNTPVSSAPTGSEASQKTVTTVPAASAPAPIGGRAARTVSNAPVTAERYAAAQVIYQARNLYALQSAADASADGVAEGLPLELAGIPGTPTVTVIAKRNEGITFTISGSGTYDIRGMVLDAKSATLKSFRGNVFTVVLSDYENLGAVAALITYIPEETLTFAPGTGGIVLPPPTDIAPIAPTAPTVPITPTQPIAVAPKAAEPPREVFELRLPLVASTPAPETGIIREIPSGEAPEEIISKEEEVSEPIAKEDELEEAPSEEAVIESEEVVEEPGFFDDIGGAFSRGVTTVRNFFRGLFGAEEVEEIMEEEVSFESEIVFEGEGVEEDKGLSFADFSAGGQEIPEGEAEFFEGEPDELFALDEGVEESTFDFTNFGISPGKFVGAESVGDLDFGFGFGDLMFESEREEIPAPDEEFSTDVAASEDIGDFNLLDVGDVAFAPKEEFVSEEEGFLAEEEFFEELFTPDISAPLVPDYRLVGNDIVVSVPLDGVFDVYEQPLIASLVFTPISGGRALEFAEPIDAFDTVTFVIPRPVLAVLGHEMRVLLKTTATFNGFLVVSTDVLGAARNE